MHIVMMCQATEDICHYGAGVKASEVLQGGRPQLLQFVSELSIVKAGR